MPSKNQKSKDTIKLNLTIQEIYNVACPDCKEKIQAIVKSKLADAMIRKALEGKG